MGKFDWAQGYAWTRKCIVCGREYTVTHDNMRKTCSPECERAARSAAHKGKPSPARMDVAGQTFGELTAIRRTESGKWLFRCSCGKEIERPLRSVKNCPRVVSCGHVLAERAEEKMREIHERETMDGTRPPALERIAAGKPRKSNTSGATGVRVRHGARGDTYEARIMLRGKQINLGTYATIQEAVQARKLAETTYWEPEIRAWHDMQDKA